MEFDPELLRQLIATFSTELKEQSQNIVDALLQLEKNTNTVDATKSIETIFRSAHNIKGAARSVGIDDLGEIAHHLESLFSAIQKKQTAISPTIIDLSLEAVDKMSIVLDAFVNKTPLSFDLTDLLKRLETGESNKTQPKPAATIIKNKPTPPPAPPVEKKETIEHSDYETIRVALTNIDRISALMEEIQVNKIAIDDHYTGLTQVANKIKHFGDVWKQISTQIKNCNNKEVNEQLSKLQHTGADAFIDITNAANDLHKNLRANVNELSILSHSLQDEVRMLRLVPATNLLSTFPRYVRDLSRELNKQVQLIIKGDDVKIDKMILEGLKDPLIHLLRNAIDHGIESPAIRQSLGKPEMGTIEIHVRDEGGNILIQLIDDGSGIDAKQIADIAKNKNLITAVELETMSEAEILELIFSPGFSTKEIITNISGRGVGLDVVRANINDLKGTVTIHTVVGKGTTFTLRLPLTLTSERGIMVSSSSQLFVIPTSGVERVLMVPQEQIKEVEGQQVVMVENHPIPLRLLSALLGFEKSHTLTRHQWPIIVIKKNNEAIALLVDEIISEREIVLKPLQAPYNHIPTVVGGTLLENNQVVMVLNCSDLINMALRAGRNIHIAFENKAEKEVERPHILVVDDSITTRTLERSVLESKNYKVSVAVNGQEGWDLLQKEKFALLITDVSMPIMDGFTLTEHVKKSSHLNQLPVIIVTSLGSDEEKRRGIEAGADAYIVKNEFESSALLEIVGQLI